jgi:anti-sigma factor RsiW
MQCEQAQPLIGALVDDVLAGQERRTLLAHLRDCARCAALEAGIRADAPRLAALGRVAPPEGMHARIGARLAQADTDEDFAWADPVQPVVPVPRNRLPPGWLGLAAMLVLVCGLSSGATWFVVTHQARDAQVVHDVLAAHVRSLLQDAPIQVASSDAHTVKPWLVGRVDFAPEVHDLSAEGFPLLGGRLDFVDGRRVAVMVYKRRLHTINVFAWLTEAAGNSAPRLIVRNGYSLVTWAEGGVTHAAISDLNSDELLVLQKLL